MAKSKQPKEQEFFNPNEDSGPVSFARRSKNKVSKAKRKEYNDKYQKSVRTIQAEFRVKERSKSVIIPK